MANKLNDAWKIYSQAQIEYYYFQITKNQKALENLLKEIEADGTTGERKYSEASRYKLFLLPTERIVPDFSFQKYSDGTGLIFYLSLHPANRQRAVDGCGLYLKGIAKDLYKKCSNKSNKKEQKRWERIYTTFIKWCILSHISDKDLEEIVSTDQSISLSKIRNYFSIIEENNSLLSRESCYRIDFRLAILQKTNDIQFILNKISKMKRKSWDCEYEPYRNIIIRSDEENGLLLLAKHLISCLEEKYKDNLNQKQEEIEKCLGEYLEIISRETTRKRQLAHDQHSIARLCPREGYIRLLEKCNFQSHIYLKDFVAEEIINRFSRGEISKEYFVRGIKFVSDREKCNILAYYFDEEETIMQLSQMIEDPICLEALAGYVENSQNRTILLNRAHATDNTENSTPIHKDSKVFTKATKKSH